jgi:hypothetical protein
MFTPLFFLFLAPRLLIELLFPESKALKILICIAPD